MGDRLATADMGRKVWGAAVPLFGRVERGLHLTQCRLGRGLPPVHTKWHLDLSNRLATIHQRHRQTDRQDRTDNGLTAYRANRFTNGRQKTGNM